MAILTLEQAFRLAFEQIHTGNKSQADRLYQHLRANPPPHAQGLLLVAVLARELGLENDSVDFSNRAIHLKSPLSHAPYQSAIVYAALGRTPEAINAYRQAAALLPADSEIRGDLGALLHRSGQLDEAIRAYQEALSIRPNDAPTLSNLGHALNEKGQLEQSAEVLQRAIALQPDLAAAHNNLGNTYEQLNRPAEALAAFRQAVALQPQLAEAHNNLGNALQRMSRFEDAIAEYSKAVELDPNYPDALVNLGNALKDAGQVTQAISLYRRAVDLSPLSWHSSNLLLALYYDPAITPEQLLIEHRMWAARISTPLVKHRLLHTNSKDPHRRLRIGYVSGDFRHHVVGYNLLPLFEHHDHANFEIFSYSTLARADDLTRRFRSLSDHWRDVKNSSDDDLAAQIRADQIDILVDLSLHTGSHRLPVFARKPAPIQVTFAGYPGTTGLSTIDYRLTDPHLDPPGSNDAFYSEVSWRLPHTFWCYQPISEAPPVNVLPALTTGHITFGSLTNFCKVNDAVLALWAKVLANVPNSHLLMMARPGPHRDRTRQFLQSQGVAPTRIDFVDYQPREQYLQTYNRIDIGLDTFPYNGHTTSLDSFWMGVPVVTLAGKTAVSRAGFSQLTNLGLPHLVATIPDQFISIAATLAADPQSLNTLRQSLRPRMLASPLTNAPQFAQDIQSAYRQMWLRYVASDEEK